MRDSVPPRPTGEFPAASESAEDDRDAASTGSGADRIDADPTAVFSWLEREVRPAVDDRIEQVLSESAFSDRLTYQIRTGGKRVRPGLVLTSAELCGLDRDRALDLAAGVELIHTYSLVHDDLVDNDEVRRGEPAFWRAFDRSDAVNVGDMLLTYALETLPEEVSGRAVATVKAMTEGQQLDLDFADRRDCTVEDYLTMVWKKTGVLFDFCVTAPASLAGTSLGVDHEPLRFLWEAFQIRDDVLDLEPGNGRGTVGNDIRAGKRTLMVVHADDEAIYDVLDKPATETTDADVVFVRERFEAHGSVAFAVRRMTRSADAAADALRELPESPQRERLEALCRFVVERGTEAQGR